MSTLDIIEPIRTFVVENVGTNIIRIIGDLKIYISYVYLVFVIEFCFFEIIKMI